MLVKSRSLIDLKQSSTLEFATTSRPKLTTSRRPKQKKSKCRRSRKGNFCDVNYWDKKTKKELIDDPKRYNTETEAADYLPNEFDSSCGSTSKSGYIVGGQDSKIGEFPFVAALGLYHFNNLPTK